MGYLENLLGQDERILYATRRHWLTFFAQTWAHLLLLLLGIALAVVANLPDLGGQLIAQLKLTQTEELALRVAIVLVLVIYPVVVLEVRYLHWHSDRFVVTNLRVIHIEGILSKHVIDSSLEKVNDVMLTQSMLGRMLNYGYIEILTSSEIGVNKLNRIARPLGFKRAMLDAKQELEGVAQRRGSNVPQLIADLAALRDHGDLTEAEFQAQKAGLLKKMQ